VLEISRREHGGVPRLGVGTDLSFKANDSTHVVDIIDASTARADRLDHSYYSMSREAVADMTQVLNGVPVETRLKAANGGSATLACRANCAPNYRLKTDGHPRFVTRLILNLLPLVPLVR
jgi:esterase/lipase superfamily enzyme